MAVRLRLRRMGRKKLPIYALVAADARSPRDGRFIEDLGRYEPLSEPAAVRLNEDRILYWLGEGAQPTHTVRNLLSEQGVMLRLHLLRKGKPEEEIEQAVTAFLSHRAENRVVKKTKAELRQERLDAERAVAAEKAKEIEKARAEREAELEKQRQEAEDAERAERAAADAQVTAEGGEEVAAEAEAATEEVVEEAAPESAPEAAAEEVVEEAAPEAAAEEVIEKVAPEAAAEDVVEEAAPEAAVEDAAEEAAPEVAAEEVVEEAAPEAAAEAAAEETAPEAATEEVVEEDAPEACGEEAAEEAVPEAATEELVEEAAPEAAGEEVAEEPVVEETAAEGPVVVEASIEPDKLTKLRGIGPKFSALLNEHDITTFAQLAALELASLRTIVSESGISASSATEESWARQAGFAAAGDWDGLKAYIEELKKA
ncbi:MAG: 30S ribosomal protein S16 [Bacteroidetes bacterium]|nr:30S ribosomal protein S16 [Bacteroidota bacterium]